MTDTDLLEYINKFYGYGSPSAGYWFVGMEEGGASATLPRRVSRWKELGASSFVDLHAMLEALPDGRKWFGEQPPIQTTWGKLIRLVLLAQGQQLITTESVRAYQASRLGRTGGETALLELMPLPSRNVAEWRHETRLPQLESRASYERAFRSARVARILELIDQHRPPRVIFYGSRRKWPTLLNVIPKERDGFAVAQRGTTRLLFMNHPAARGLTSAYLQDVAKAIAT